MISSETLTVIYGLGSALVWGAGDFCGGFASKKGSALTVIFYSQIIGLGLLVTLRTLFPSSALVPGHCLWGALAGICGVIGLIALYRGLSRGRMGVVAPISAVMTALVPLVFSLFTEGLPKQTQMLGFGAALLAVWFYSVKGDVTGILKTELYLSVLAGVGFGLFFICIDHVSQEAILWPLLSARLTSIFIIGITLVRRRQITLPPWGQFAYIALAGLLDIVGNIFFALASQLGRLDVAAVLTSMYPISTVLLARCVLKERLQFKQRMGLLAAVFALVFIAL